MASGVGVGILMSSAVASLSEVLPAYAEEIAAKIHSCFRMSSAPFLSGLPLQFLRRPAARLGDPA